MNRLTAVERSHVIDALIAYVSHQQGQPTYLGEHTTGVRPQVCHWAASAVTVTVWAFEVRGPRGTFALHWSKADGPVSPEWVITTAKVLCVLAGVTV